MVAGLSHCQGRHSCASCCKAVRRVQATPGFVSSAQQAASAYHKQRHAASQAAAQVRAQYGMPDGQSLAWLHRPDVQQVSTKSQVSFFFFMKKCDHTSLSFLVPSSPHLLADVSLKQTLTCPLVESSESSYHQWQSPPHLLFGPKWSGKLDPAVWVTQTCTDVWYAQ